MLESIAPYRKFFAFLVVGVIQALVNFGTDDGVTGAEIMHSVIFAMGLGTVYVAEETPGAKGFKTAIAAITVGLQGLVSAMDVGAELSSQVWLSVFIGVAGVLGVAIPHNKVEHVRPGTNTAEPLDVRDLPQAA